MITTINRENLESLLVNDGQNKVGPAIKEFAQEFEKIESIDDIVNLYQVFRTNMKHDVDKIIPKFERTSEEIIASKVRSGCSDVGTALAPILRLKGIPTIYVQSAHIDWIKDFYEKNENATRVRGHIFLEIYLDNKWMLFDPTNGHLYPDYDYNNKYLPQGCIAFSKSLNGHELGFVSLKTNNDKMMEIYKGKELEDYIDPNYTDINLKNL